MAKKWSDVAASAAFQALSFEEQEEARRQYFEAVIAPHVPSEDVSLARDQFFADTALRRPAVDTATVDYGQAATDMMGGSVPAPTDRRGLIQRVGELLRPAPKPSVLDRPATGDELQRMQQADIDRRLSYGAGPIRPEVVTAADQVRSTRGSGDQIKFRDQSYANRVGKVVDAMDQRGEQATAQVIADLNRQPLREAATDLKAEEFRSVGEWAADTLSSLSQGVVTLAQLPVNIIAPSSSLAESMRQTQKELQAQESDVSKASRDVLRRRVENEDGFLGKYFETVKQLVTNPTLSVNEAIKQVPMFLGVIAGARLVSAAAGTGVTVAGRAAPTVALADAISGGAVTAGARAAGSAVGGLGTSMVMAGGDAAGNTYETLTDPRKTPLSDWQQNPDYQRLLLEKLTQGRTEEQAKSLIEQIRGNAKNPNWFPEDTPGGEEYVAASKAAIQEIATTKARMAALITAPLGVLGYMGAEAAVASRGLGRAAADALTPKGAAKLVLKDNLGEQGEEGGTQLGSNLVTGTVNQNQDPFEGVAQAMATAGVTSTPMNVLGAASQYQQARQQAQARDPITDALAIESLRTSPGTSNFIRPEATVANFTPAGSPTQQAGLVDIVVPMPGAAADPALGDLNVGATGVPGGLAGAGGVGGSGVTGGGLGTAGLGDAATAGGGGGIAPGVGANDRSAVSAGGAADQSLASLTRPFARATDADLLSRTEAAIAGQQNNNADTAATKIWAGRGKAGYANEQDAEQAMATASVVIDTKQTHDWRVEPIGNGRFQIVGYQKGAGLENNNAQVNAAAGQAVGAADTTAAAGTATATQAANAAPFELSDSERAGLRLAPPAPASTFTQIQKQLAKRRGVTVEAVPVADLTDSQRVASAVARLMGNTLTVVSATAGNAANTPNAFINRVGGNHIFLASNADDAPVSLAFHEGYHGLPTERRKALNTALLEVFNEDQKGEFLREFNYTLDKFDEEAPAMMAQAISKRADFWEQLRDKMGNREFGEVAKVILSKLNQVITGAKDQYGEAFVSKYIKDVVKARDLLTTAYAESMQAQGFKPDAEVSGQVMASERTNSRIGLDFKDVVKRTPALQAAAEKVKAGEMTAAEYDKLVNEAKPVEPYKSVPQPANNNEIRTALTSDKVDRIGVPSQTLKAGAPVGLRLDIPAYSNHGTWVVSVHEQEAGYNAGKSIGYEPVAAATNVTFGVVEKAAMNIAAGKPKATIAVIKGGWKPTTPKQAKVMADQALKSKDWVQVGMDPERHSYFYDRATMEPVTAADEVIQIGPLVLAKNPTYGDKAEFMFSEKAREPVKLADYKPASDNFNKQRDMVRMLGEAVPAETIAKADEFVARYYSERKPVAVSPEDRLKAEILLRPKMKAAEQVKPEYDQKILDIAARTGALGQMLAPIKGIKRAAEKLAIEENFQVDNIKDLLRSTIVVESYADALPIVDEIRKEFDVVRIKDRAEAGVMGQGVTAAPREQSGGYGDILINIRMPNGTLGEIQINTPAMLAAKDGQGHKLYEAAREQPDGSSLRQEIFGAMRVLYDAAFEAANLRAPSAQARNLASEMGAPRAGSDLTSTSSSPESASLKTLPSGKATNSSPENDATNSEPGGKEAGTFIEGSPDKASLSQSQYSGGAPAPRRGAERVGDFDVRTMKDGTIVVYGEAEAIRAQIPEDVKGRNTKDGIVFTTSAAPRVKAALAGRKTAYSRGGAVLDKLPMKDGKYVGAPEKYNTPAKIVALRKQLRKLTVEGERGRYWYENSSRAILRMTGGNVQEARKFVALLAIYSPQARVDSNSTFALRAWAQYKAGQPISVKTGVQDKKATEAMADVDAFWSGEKTGNFFFNLLREIDTSTAGKQGATIDMWMMRAAEYVNDAPTPTQYAFMENETNRIAQEMGWEPQQVQAAIWVAMKARMENKGVKERTEATSEKEGWIRFERNAKGKKERVILDKQKHRDNWLKHAMEHVPTKEDTEQAKFDFADGVGRHIGQLSFEARPGRTTDILSGIHDAPYAQQVEFQQAVQRAFYDDNGVDMLAVQLGLLSEPNDIMRPGVWQGDVSPSTQKRVAMAPAAGDAGKSNVDPAQSELLNVYAAVAGLVARQEGVGWHRPFYAGTKRDANGLDIDIGRALKPDEARALEVAIGRWMDGNGLKDWQNSFALISSPTGIRAVNFGIITNDVLQSEIVKVAEGVLPDFEYRVFASSGDMPSNDWKVNPNGQGYVQRISAAGRSDVLEWTRSVLAPRVQRVFEQFAEKYQWGDPGRIEFSNRSGSDAAGGGRDRGVGQEDLQGSVTPSYGTPRDGASSAVGYHYSRQSRNTLSSAMYGTGLRGAEMERLQGADPRLKQRVYFYIDRGTGINPEAGVGGYAHRVNLQNLYDVDEDALRLRRDADGFNAFEAAVLDAGFDGYMVRDAGPSGNAVLLGQHAVPVEQLGSASRMQTADAVPAARERVLNDAEKISANRSLPSGALTGAQWAAVLERQMPEVYGRLADAEVWASTQPMYRSELTKALKDEGIQFSNRRLPKVSPQSALEADIASATEKLTRAIQEIRRNPDAKAGPKIKLGRLPHVLNMLGARTQDMDIARSIVYKVFLDPEKHRDEFASVTPGQFVRALYRPAMVLQSRKAENEMEMVLPITGDKGAVIVPVVISRSNADPLAGIKSAYQYTVSANFDKSADSIMRRVNEGALRYVDMTTAGATLTGRANEEALTESGPRNTEGLEGGFNVSGRVPTTQPPTSLTGSITNVNRPVNDRFVAWPQVAVKMRELLAQRKIRDEVSLMRWIGDNYKPESSDLGWSDAPAFSNRRQRLSTIGQNFTLPAATRTDDVRRVLQDDALRMKRVLDAVKAKGGTVGEAQNFYDANTLMPGRIQAAIDDFRDNVIRPLTEKAAKYGIDFDELSLFAYAKHAQERNEYIASINPRMPDGGSGMKTADANQILQQVASGPKAQQFEELHKDLMAITSTTRQLLMSQGLITQDEFDALDGQYQNYIPLRGLENVDDEGRMRPGVGRGVNVRGQETVRAMGRRSQASDLIENVIRDYERVISRVEKNDVGKVLLDFVLSNPDPDLWGVDVERSKPAFNKATGLVQYTKQVEKGEDTIGVKVGGQQVYIKLADADLARALRQAWKDETSGLERATLAMTGWWNNWLRAVLTRYNPAFAAINIPRDALWSGTASALAELGASGLVKYLAAYPKAFMASARREAGVAGTNSRLFGNVQMDARFAEFRSAGGITGGYFMRSLDDIDQDLRNDLLSAGAAPRNTWESIKSLPPFKLAKLTLKMLEFMGSASENATRFALYQAARESGRSPAQAGVLAKDGTTNFNRKGEWGGALNNLYLFYNAGVQGTTQLAKVLKSPAVMASMAGVSAIGMMLALYGAASGGEDDDEEKYWDKIPSFVKERNIVIMLPPGDALAGGIERVGKRGRYITIPVQYGFNIFPNLGYVMADVLRNQADPKRGMTPTKAALHMTSTVFGSVNPFGGSVDVSDPVQVLLAAMPTLVDLPVQVINERNTFGSPSAPTKSPFDKRPDSERMFTSQQDTMSAKIAKTLNEMGGGNEAKEGSVLGVNTSVTPGTIQTLISATTGGLGTFVEQMGTAAIAMTGDDQDMKANKIPFLNKFYGEVDEGANIRTAGERMREIRKLSDEVKAQQKLGLDPKLQDEEERILSLASMQQAYERQSSMLRKREIEIIKDPKMTEAQKKLERKSLQIERDRLATDVNREYLRTVPR